MSKEQLQEAMTLLSRLTVEQIQSVMQVNQETISLTMMLSKPSPPLSAKHVQTVNNRWQQEHRVHFHQLVAPTFLGHGANREVDMALQFGTGAAVFEPFEAYGDGAKAWKGVLHMHKLNNRELGALESELLDKSSKYHKAILKASQKIGIPKTTADMNADSFMRTTFVRNAVNAAGINMAETALFDIKTLFDADFRNYFLKLCISGAYAWSVPREGGEAGTAVGGPIGGLLGRLVGGLGGGFAGRWSAGRWSGLREITDAEVEKSYETIVENCAKIGVYPDPSLSKRDIVAGMLDESTSSKAVLVRITGATAADLRNLKNSLSDWQQGSPEGFEVFLQGLRDAATSELPIFAQRSLEGNVQEDKGPYYSPIKYMVVGPNTSKSIRKLDDAGIIVAGWGVIRREVFEKTLSWRALHSCIGPLICIGHIHIDNIPE
ncbi:uncharacterized protein FPRO_14832 [Fusarium proliferatum ET1]|uniref:Uncharacterized protein n=1 Tax=Fusarium proliferatum (strain ET1) TaxID=1227346 RepID=A0A1L7WAR0_FUSPR|nr:uncharacterized protein FPRO_14832 [Fusarium proliferatum ET1]CZR49690.1 uncharacterized protein FPRO_14832 [Fusarium proliferatum ET1]